MRVVLSLIFLNLLCFPNLSQAQSSSWQWQKVFGSNNTTQLLSALHYSNDDFFVLFQISSPVTFGDTTINNAGEVICKFSSSGALEWVRGRAGGVKEHIVMTLDSNENVMMVGTTPNSKYIAQRWTKDGSEVPALLPRYYPSSYDGSVGVAGVCTDPAGNYYVAGEFVGSTFFGSSSIEPNTKRVSRDVCLLKFNNKDSLLWSYTLGYGDRDEYATDVAFHRPGSLYLFGNGANGDLGDNFISAISVDSVKLSFNKLQQFANDEILGIKVNEGYSTLTYFDRFKPYSNLPDIWSNGRTIPLNNNGNTIVYPHYEDRMHDLTFVRLHNKDHCFASGLFHNGESIEGQYLTSKDTTGPNLFIIDLGYWVVSVMGNYSNSYIAPNSAGEVFVAAGGPGVLVGKLSTAPATVRSVDRSNGFRAFYSNHSIVIENGQYPEVSVYDVLGRLMLRRFATEPLSNSECKIPDVELPKGEYFVVSEGHIAPLAVSE